MIPIKKFVKSFSNEILRSSVEYHYSFVIYNDNFFLLILCVNFPLKERKFDTSSNFQNRCIESEKETQMVILIYPPFLNKHVGYRSEDYRPFYIDSGSISRFFTFENFIISLI